MSGGGKYRSRYCKFSSDSEQTKKRNYRISQFYWNWSGFGELANSSTHVTIFAGALAGAAELVNQIRAPGTAAQTSMVRIISQTAVIFSTMIISVLSGYISFKSLNLPLHTNIHSLSRH